MGKQAKMAVGRFFHLLHVSFDIVFVVHFQKKKINIKSLICSVEL